MLTKCFTSVLLRKPFSSLKTPAGHSWDTLSTVTLNRKGYEHVTARNTGAPLLYSLYAVKRERVQLSPKKKDNRKTLHGASRCLTWHLFRSLTPLAASHRAQTSWIPERGGARARAAADQRVAPCWGGGAAAGGRLRRHGVEQFLSFHCGGILSSSWEYHPVDMETYVWMEVLKCVFPPIFIYGVLNY